MAVRIPASPKDARAEPKSEDKALDGRQNSQDDEASRKMADEGDVSQKKNRLPDEDGAIVHVNGSGRSICLYLMKEYRMNIIYKTSQNERPTLLANADALVSPAAQHGLFAKAFWRAVDWLAGDPAVVTPVRVRSLADVRINSHYDALGRS
ncbi:hypothetical protein [Paracoccus acridae]|nr:hypothetical protein [Paracoccus acridae]